MTPDKSKVYIVIPAFNEGKVIAKVIRKIQKEGFSNIIVIDDGSLDDTYKIAKNNNVTVLKHLINRGKGSATQTGLEVAKRLNAEIVVTMDADGQHSEKDIIKLVKPIADGKVDVVLGSRFLLQNKIPPLKTLANKIGNFVTWLFYGIYVTDSQSGFRAYSNKANNLIETTMDRYEFESEILYLIKKNNLIYQEVPIEVFYTHHSKTKYDEIPNFTKQKITNGFIMIYRMTVRSILS